jgi:hypothetical protein
MLEEWEFLDETCLTALYASRDVSFAAVVDINGKLIVGKSRKRNRKAKLSILSNTHSISLVATVTSRCYTFYFDYLVKAIRRCYFKNKRPRGDEKEEANFEMMDIDNNLKLAITPLTKAKDKYLCIYFESRISSSTQQIILRINNTI